MNPSVELLEAMPPTTTALVWIDAGGNRHEYTVEAAIRASSGVAGRLRESGVDRGDVVMMLLGSRPEWVWTMLACWRIGAIALPCHAMLTSKDIALRIAASGPKVIVTDRDSHATLPPTAGECTVLTVPDPDFASADPAEAADLAAEDPAVIIFTSGTSSTPKGIVHAQRWIAGQRLQATEWFAARPGTLAWCTAAPGWSKSARNSFLAPWMCGATAMLHEGRFDPHERLEILRREGVATLCQAPTEYRVMAARGAVTALPALENMVAAGEALDASVIETFREATGVRIRDGYGQTETNHLTAVRPGDDAPHGSMGRALTGVSLQIVDGELVVDPASVPTFFTGSLDGADAPVDRPWHTGDLVREEDGWLFFEGRRDDIISSSGYRIGPLEVEAALATHPAVAESAVIGVPDAERGQVVKAVVVVRDGFAPSPDLAAGLQAHVKAETAPYKYPRIVEFADSLPRTNSGKVRRSALRGDVD